MRTRAAMRRILFFSMLALSACGRDELLDGTGEGDLVQRQQQQPLIVGSYEFGPMVAQGFAGTPGRLATMRVNADGSLSMLFFLGCIGNGASGSWVPQGAGARVELDGSPSTDGWIDADANHLDVATLRVDPGIDGVIVSGRTTQGVAFSQAWAKRR